MKNSTKKIICGLLLIVVMVGCAFAYYGPSYLSGYVTLTHPWKYYGGVPKQTSGKTQGVTFTESTNDAKEYKVKPQAYLSNQSAYVDVGNEKIISVGSYWGVSSTTTIDAGVSVRMGYTLISDDPIQMYWSSDRAYMRYDFY